MKSFYLSLILLISVKLLYGQVQDSSNSIRIRVEWKDIQVQGEVEVKNGSIANMEVIAGIGSVQKNSFHFESDRRNSIAITFEKARSQRGSGATLVTINSDKNAFSFFLRDVNSSYPIIIPEYKVVVLPYEDSRTFDDIFSSIPQQGPNTKGQNLEDQEEESYEQASQRTRDQSVPTWLGISRDIRLFEISPSIASNPFERDVISPKFGHESLIASRSNGRALNYSYVMGRGQGVQSNLSRRLKKGVLPILTSSLMDGGIQYSLEMFAGLEQSNLRLDLPYGTNFWVADHFLAGHMFTEEQEKIVQEKLDVFQDKEREETVLFSRMVARNVERVPRYAWFKIPCPGRAWWDRFDYRFIDGFSEFSEEEVFLVAKLNGNPISDEEMAVLIPPNDSIVVEYFIPHSPISRSRANKLMSQSYDQKVSETQDFWENKLQQAGQITLPEKRVEEMIQAGLLNLDLITYGNEPDGPLAPSIGIYAPIGTESAPIIQFYMTMGLFEEARRSLMYFLEKQRPNGMIQNFGGYMVETGAVLWSIGEFYRYTQDTEWIKSIKPRLIRSCQFLIDWRQENKKPELQGKGYGLIAGKVADPDDPFHQFMLNGYGYLGLSRMAEILHPIDSNIAHELSVESDAWKEDILTSFRYSMAHSPIIPKGDGTWCPTVGPWTEGTGPRSLFVDEELSYSHGTFTVADVLLGPLYLVFCEVLNPDDLEAKFMLDYHQEILYQNNAAFSQPYYSRHNWVQLKRGMVKPFLKTYYNTFSSLADRETHAFWEHVYHASPYKTHEQGWFLMETRWMLWHEVGDTLNLLSTIPRKWMESGEKIQLNHVASYFGPIFLQVHSDLENGEITAVVSCSDRQRLPKTVTIRLPHPNEKIPTSVTGGIYDKNREMVIINQFSGSGKVVLKF